MDVLKNIINQFMDLELLIIIGCIVVFLVLLRVFNNFLSRHRILRVGVIGIILINLVIGIFWLVEHRTDFYSNTVTNYVYGEVKNISSAVRKVEIKVSRANVKNKEGKSIINSTIVVDMDINSKFLDDKGNEISFNDIGFYDTVQIYVKEKKINDIAKDKLSGVKLVLKYDNSQHKI